MGVDEARFFNISLIDVCNKMVDNGIRVIVAGLDMDYQGKPFGAISHLLAILEYITKVHAICVSYGNWANRSHRLTDIDKLVV